MRNKDYLQNQNLEELKVIENSRKEKALTYEVLAEKINVNRIIS